MYPAPRSPFIVLSCVIFTHLATLAASAPASSESLASPSTIASTEATSSAPASSASATSRTNTPAPPPLPPPAQLLTHLRKRQAVTESEPTPQYWFLDALNDHGLVNNNGQDVPLPPVGQVFDAMANPGAPRLDPPIESLHPMTTEEPSSQEGKWKENFEHAPTPESETHEITGDSEHHGPYPAPVRKLIIIGTIVAGCFAAILLLAFLHEMMGKLLSKRKKGHDHDHNTTTPKSRFSKSLLDNRPLSGWTRLVQPSTIRAPDPSQANGRKLGNGARVVPRHNEKVMDITSNFPSSKFSVSSSDYSTSSYRDSGASQDSVERETMVVPVLVVSNCPPRSSLLGFRSVITPGTSSTNSLGYVEPTNEENQQQNQSIPTEMTGASDNSEGIGLQPGRPAEVLSPGVKRAVKKEPRRSRILVGILKSSQNRGGGEINPKIG